MNKRLIAGVIAAASCGYLLWQYFTPVEIVAVHDGNTIMVRHFPYLKSRQIAWWETNKDMIQAKYGIPEEYDSYYYISFVDFGDGYRTEPNESLLFWTDDVFCFYDIKTDARCVDRKPLLTVRWSKNNGLEFESY
ncbi:DUF943 family protein [Siccibacter colletis]|uniref:DUF943 family protein n=1 Tax=Siccibacter colletis TaxID=1505757 RepID=UPI0028BD1FAE|nr:DUF943 family protein [Siccibacter colletis]WNN47805.1 DUF943 family protein [Siccibacter colletis]